MKKEEISVCPECRNPLLWTYIFRGSEWFCLNCKWNGGMMSADSMESTIDLKKKLKKDVAFFEKHRPYIHMGGGYLIKGCKKCSDRVSPHQYHMTEKEKVLHNKAKKALGI